MKKIKVAFFAEILTENIDGAVRTMYQLINRIDHTRFDFLFLYGVGPDNINGFESFKLPAINLPFSKVYSIALPGLFKAQLTGCLQAFGPQIVHIATPSLLGHFALKYAKSAGLPVITIYHTHFLSYVDYYLKHAPRLINSAKQTLAENHRSFYNQCDKIYVPSESIKAELAAIDITNEKMTIWKRGIDNTVFSPAKRDNALMRQLIGNDNPVILFASRLVWEKNLETLFAIYDGFENEGAKLNFLIAGDGTARKDCELKMKNAFFTGAIDHHNLANLYASAHIFLFPSVSEAYGNVVLEAMASGLPCVIANGGGSQDFVEQGINGFKCEPYNANDYIKKIKILLSNNLLAQQFAAEGLAYSKTFCWDNLADQYFNDLTELTKTTHIVLS